MGLISNFPIFKAILKSSQNVCHSLRRKNICCKILFGLLTILLRNCILFSNVYAGKESNGPNYLTHSDKWSKPCILKLTNSSPYMLQNNLKLLELYLPQLYRTFHMKEVLWRYVTAKNDSINRY